MARLTEQELFEIQSSAELDEALVQMPGAVMITGLSDRKDVGRLVAEVRRLRGLLLVADRIICTFAPVYPTQPPPETEAKDLRDEVDAIRAERK